MRKGFGNYTKFADLFLHLFIYSLHFTLRSAPSFLIILLSSLRLLHLNSLLSILFLFLYFSLPFLFTLFSGTFVIKLPYFTVYFTLPSACPVCYLILLLSISVFTSFLLLLSILQIPQNFFSFLFSFYFSIYLLVVIHSHFLSLDTFCSTSRLFSFLCAFLKIFTILKKNSNCHFPFCFHLLLLNI
jgi:hypothetical protein